MIVLPFGLQSFFGAKNRIREDCQKCLRFEYERHIDSISFLPFGLQSLFGAKNRIREGAPEMSYGTWSACLSRVRVQL